MNNRNTVLLISAVLAVVLMSSCEQPGKQDAASADLVIVGASVIHPDSDKPPQVEDIVISDGRIVAVGPGAASGYDSKETVDARGKFIIPGLADMHSHFGNGILGPDKDDTKQVLARHLYFGNTTILNLGSSQAWPKRIDELRADMESGKIQGPRLLAVGSLMTMSGSGLIISLMRVCIAGFMCTRPLLSISMTYLMPMARAMSCHSSYRSGARASGSPMVVDPRRRPR